MAANTSKKYCTKLDTYDPTKFVVLTYTQPAKKKSGKVIYTDIDGKELTDYNKLGPKINKELMKKFVQIINKNEVCANILSTDYTNYNRLVVNNTYMVLFDVSETDVLYPADMKITDTVKKVKKIIKGIGRPVAFILAHDKLKDDEQNAVKEAYIDILCACSGSGKALLNYFISAAEKNGTYTAVSLSAIPTVLTYYPTFHFSHRKTCLDGAKKIIPKKELIALARTGNYKYIEQVYNNPYFLEYLIELRDNGYGKIDGNCATATTSREMNEAKCGDDGYIMRRCLNLKKDE
jgi:hypothetical protein